MTKAYAYLRVSGKGQVKGDGFPRQIQAIKTYAAAHDFKIVQVFREEGVTGTKESMDRPAWAAMMTALHGNGVKTILIESWIDWHAISWSRRRQLQTCKKAGLTLFRSRNRI